ncbi:hypothetical protein HA402_011659 [Bradysia odoriphaga]|nr:hypothetical protein HA402_011659 [Bradysia odoriphaga]
MTPVFHSIDVLPVEKIVYIMYEYVQVAEDEHKEPVELPTEEDGTLSLTLVQSQYPGTLGLKFRNTQTNRFRLVKLDEKKLYPPPGSEGWGSTIYYCDYKRGTNRIPEYIRVLDDEHNIPIEISTENDGTVLLSSIKEIYPDTVGLSYINSYTNEPRLIVLADGRLLPPPGSGWSSRVYNCIMRKEPTIRELVPDPESLIHENVQNEESWSCIWKQIKRESSNQSNDLKHCKPVPVSVSEDNIKELEELIGDWISSKQILSNEPQSFAVTTISSFKMRGNARIALVCCRVAVVKTTSQFLPRKKRIGKQLLMALTHQMITSIVHTK